MVRAGCRYTHSGEGQCQQQGLGPTVGILSAMGGLLLACPSMATGSYLGTCMAVEASEESWSGKMQVQSYKGWVLEIPAVQESGPDPGPQATGACLSVRTPCLQDLTIGMCIAVEASDRSQA